jgi:Fic family protein
MNRNEPYDIKPLEIKNNYYSEKTIMPYLLDAYAKLQAYKAVTRESRIDSRCFLPAIRTREALASSAIEGTQATIEDVYEDRVNNITANTGVQEVRNYYNAISYGFTHLQTGHIDLDFLNNLNKVILEGSVHKDSDKAGVLRIAQTKITNKNTGQITYMPPKPETVEPSMINLLDYIEETDFDYNTLVRAAVIHAQFETIHPYYDGNGRVGRILVPLFLFYKQVIPSPYFFISDILEDNRTMYYSALNRLRESDDWEGWIIFFLNSIEKQCDKYLNMIHEINNLYSKDYKIISTLLAREKAKQLTEILFRNPVLNSNVVMKQMNLTRNTATKYLQTLEENRILSSNGKERYISYYYVNLLRLL